MGLMIVLRGDDDHGYFASGGSAGEDSEQTATKHKRKMPSLPPSQ